MNGLKTETTEKYHKANRTLRVRIVQEYIIYIV